jgi:hypothetical protein
VGAPSRPAPVAWEELRRRHGEAWWSRRLELEAARFGGWTAGVVRVRCPHKAGGAQWARLMQRLGHAQQRCRDQGVKVMGLYHCGLTEFGNYRG